MMFGMSIVATLLLSVLEGVTEFLPVSSTGHLILASRLLGIPATDFTKSFEIFIQLGAMMAVISLYWQRMVQQPQLFKPILIAFVPTGCLGLVLYGVIKTYLLGNDAVVAIALASVGALMILLEHYWRRHPRSATTSPPSLSVSRALAIGVFQSVSMVPGVSRAAATIIGGMATGLSRKDAVEFSFLLAVPTMAAATGLDLIKSAHAFSTDTFVLLGLGFIVSWITARMVMKAFVRLITHATLAGFGIYRIALAVLYWMLISV